MLEEYNLDLSKNYNDCGVMLYDLKKSKKEECLAGGSGTSIAVL